MVFHSPLWLENVRWQQCVPISQFWWIKPPEPMGEMWCFAPQNRSRLSMTALPVSAHLNENTDSGFAFQGKTFTAPLSLDAFILSKTSVLSRLHVVNLTELFAFISTTRSLRATTFSDWHRMGRSWRTVIYRTVNFPPQAFPHAITVYMLC